MSQRNWKEDIEGYYDYFPWNSWWVTDPNMCVTWVLNKSEKKVSLSLLPFSLFSFFFFPSYLLLHLVFYEGRSFRRTEVSDCPRLARPFPSCSEERGKRESGIARTFLSFFSLLPLTISPPPSSALFSLSFSFMNFFPCRILTHCGIRLRREVVQPVKRGRKEGLDDCIWSEQVSLSLSFFSLRFVTPILSILCRRRVSSSSFSRASMGLPCLSLFLSITTSFWRWQSLTSVDFIICG